LNSEETAQTYVYIYLKEGTVPAGLLEAIGEGCEATTRFRYGADCTPHKEAFSRFSLP
jgi:hypothetical protein